MKKIYFVQPSNILSNEVYLPYAVGAIASYAWKFAEIRKSYLISGIIFKKDPLDELLNKMEEPFLVGFSCYMWNVEYNLSLAREIKKKWPDSIIAFGGPQIPEDISYLEKYSFIDLLMFGEGERTLFQILSSYSHGLELNAINNIAFRKKDRIVQTPKKLYKDISSFPSPYASGIFDDIVNDPLNKSLRFNAIVETNRGCPYGCIYCSWAGTEKNFRQFSLDRVKADLLWMAKNKIIFCICADSNFGILDRDLEIADYLIELKQQYGYPQKFETSSAKNKEGVVFEINQKLEHAGMNCGISVAVQSFSPTVLKNIRRENLSVHDFADQMRKYRAAGIATYTDIILGLPGETFDSFCHGLFYAIESGQHYTINIHPCEVLPNTILYQPSVREYFGIKTIRSTIYQYHSMITEKEWYGIKSEIVVATNTMSIKDWRNAMRVAICVQSFHSFGLLKFVAIYLRKTRSISYYDFYMSLYRWIENDSFFTKSIFDSVCHNIDVFLEKKKNLFYYDLRFMPTFLYFKEGLFLSCIYESDRFYNEIKDFLIGFFDDNSLFEDLMRYQQYSIKYPGCPSETLFFHYDWKSFFEAMFDPQVNQPMKTDVAYLMQGCKETEWPDYIQKNIWYGKRENKMIRQNYRIQQGENMGNESIID